MPNEEISQVQLPNGDVYDIRDGNVSDFKTNINEETLSDGQVVKYNETTGEWENSENDLELLNTASGSIATFSDGGNNIPVNSFECEIVAQQESGTPTPTSPLSITGFSQADIPVTGKNLINVSGITITTQTVILSNFLLKKGTYTLSVDLINNTSIQGRFRLTRADNTSTTIIHLAINGNQSARMIGTATLSEDTYCSLVCNGASVGYNFSFDNVLLELGSTATDFEPYKGNTYLVEFGQTIYGGRLVYANGQWAIEADKAMNLISDLDWSYNDTSVRFSTSDLIGIVKNSESTAIPLEGLSCECYKNGMSGSSRQTDLSIAVAPSGTMVLKDTNYTDVSSLLSAVGNYKIVYPFATPVIIPLTSTVKVKTISGLNNIYSNTGDVSLEYFVNKADDIDKLINAEKSTESSDYHVYSTDEQVVGKWIDGNDIYERVFDLGSDMNIPNTELVDTSIDATSMSKIIQVTGMYSSGVTVYPLMANIGNNKIRLQSDRNGNTGASVRYVILQYTKTSSNTRSLNLSKGSSEELPIEEKKEELKELEEVKEVQDE